VIFGQGFLPLALDKSISNYRAAMLVLVYRSMEKQRGMAFGFLKKLL
jgi:hypothetical protein